MIVALLSLAAVAPPPTARDLLPSGGNAPGCALDVRRAGTRIESAATGQADLENPAPITADTVFEIGSVSKQFIGAGLAILAERQRLRLDDPIVKWLPELPPLYHGITVAMLAHHTSGIRSWNNLAELTGRGEDSTGYDNAWVLAAVARQHALNHAPGREYLYSNSNFVLAAIIIERAARQSLNDFFRDALFARLGMDWTQWRTDFRTVVPGRAQAYAAGNDRRWQLDMPLNGVVGAGGLLSTVGDLQRWNAMLADPAPADRGWVATLLRPGTLSDGTQIGYGLGIETSPVAGLRGWSHAGATGSYRAWLGYVPDARLSVALLCNSGAVNTEDLGPQITSRFLPPARTPAPVATAVTSPPVDLAGVYRNAANDAAVEAAVDGTGLHLNGGTGFVSAGPDRLATADGKRTISVRRTSAGAPSLLTVSRIGNAPVMLVAERSWKPSTVELSRLRGAYASADVNGVQHIDLVDGVPVWRDPSGDTHKLVPVYRGGFDAPGTGWTLRFGTGPQQRPVLDMSITRARRIRFARLADTGAR